MPSYQTLVFRASEWLEVYDSANQTLILEAKGSGEDLCLLEVWPIAGTDPVQYEYRCMSTGCNGTCELKRTVTPAGTKYWCDCPGGGGFRMASATTTKSKTGKGKAKGKAKGKGKAKAKKR
ncbi:MAG: hypothetical protein HS108_08725 [Planctomycetes bacterium]|jgi:hypothetical protein|nr:hypothetical protein [Planctomycetota bacterium]MCL4729941.1 hypothetical protein [Planctomycetota bacterium]